MKIEIWSDVACPWCYIGKRRFEKALAEFPEAEALEIEWKSFQLNPGVNTDMSDNIVNYLAREKGMSLEQARQMTGQVSAVAAEEGLDFNFEALKIANTFKAHRFLHLAKSQGKQNIVKELLLKAMFEEGKNVDDDRTLLEIGREAGLDIGEVTGLLESANHTEEVNRDISEARKLGIQGVPFFVINRKYGISGAQTHDIFLQALQQSFAEWKEDRESSLEVINGDSCTPDGNCD
ncbi:DsbA family oxidoreductase [Robertkochia aurantiaca]|uniref:DsbA family oxidoreductase n=1 Tax=Robertkochia aurantiaca TaxID=2873700 RepID=UPI001CCD04E3|nr:DsbA family oxidoreductase [Robertkochia sp. 3YJGBD-33]